LEDRRKTTVLPRKTVTFQLPASPPRTTKATATAPDSRTNNPERPKPPSKPLQPATRPKNLLFKDQVTQLPGSTIFTIGNVTLTPADIDVLNYGLSYVPVLPNTEDPNEEEITAMSKPINKTIRTLIRTEQANDGSYLVKLGLGLIPQPPRPAKKAPPHQYSFTAKLVAEMTELHKSTAYIQPKQNQTEIQLETLDRLRRNPLYIIKPVDKNLGVAVIEKSMYIELAEVQHLKDPLTYTKLDHDPLAETIEIVNTTLADLHRSFHVSYAELKELQAREDATNGVFYILPKLHKLKLDSRPICSNSDHPTRPTSKYLHAALLPTAKSAFSYLDNSTDFIKLLSEIKITRSTLVVTADIKALYTNIPTDEGPSIVAASISKDKRVETKLRTLLSLVLKNNVFTFNGEFYRQENGTAMGTIMAPTYANCYLRAKEEVGLKEWLTPNNRNVKLYKRYIDDVGAIYDNFDNSLPSFFRAMKVAYHPLELTFKIGRVSIVYLDLELTMNDFLERVDHEMHRKPSNNKTYIPSTSNHPSHMLRNILYNDMLRAHRLCNTTAGLNKHLAIIERNARKQGYKGQDIKSLGRQARAKANEPSQTAEDNDPTPTIVTLTYNGARTETLAQGLREKWTATAEPENRLMIAYRTHDNFKKLAVRSRAPQPARQHRQVDIRR
jgi:hypothetical protein